MRQQPWTKRDVKIIPSLIIGLGGTGQDVVRHLKRRVRLEWSGSNTNYIPEVIQFITADSISYANRPDQEFLRPSEYTFMGGFDPIELIQDKVGYQSIASWWKFKPATIPPGIIHLGARQIRALGRLALFHSFPEIWANIKDKITRINNISAAVEVTRHGYNLPIETSARQVFIVSSLCGGTGAGCFMDIAARIRAEYGTKLHIVGIFLLPSAFEHDVPSLRQVERIHANAYAAIKELDNFWYLDKDFAVQYPGNPYTTQPQHPMFDQIYLLGRDSRNRHPSSLNDIKHQISHFLYLQTINNLADPIGERLVNFDKLKKYYSSFAVGALSMPEQKVADYLLADIKYQILSNILHDERHDINVQDLEEEIQKFITNIEREVPSDRFINKPEHDYNVHMRQERYNIIAKTLRWYLGTILPKYGIKSINRVIDMLDQKCNEFQNFIYTSEKDLASNQEKFKVAQNADQGGRFYKAFANFRGAKQGSQFYEDNINTLEADIAFYKVLVRPDNARAEPRYLNIIINTCNDIKKGFDRFANETDRVKSQLVVEQEEARDRASTETSPRTVGKEKRYYDMEIDPTIPGKDQAFDILQDRVSQTININQSITATNILRSKLPQGEGIIDEVKPPPIIQLFGFYTTEDGKQSTGHLQSIGEAGRLINRQGNLNIVEREAWEIDSLTEEIAITLVTKAMQQQTSLVDFFKVPYTYNTNQRQVMIDAIQALLGTMMNHVQPFWSSKAFPRERELERLKFLCFKAKDPDKDPQLHTFFRDFLDSNEYQFVEGSNPFRLDALFIEHGAEPQDIDEMKRCKQAYDSFSPAEREGLHLNPEYTKLQDIDWTRQP